MELCSQVNDLVEDDDDDDNYVNDGVDDNCYVNEETMKHKRTELERNVLLIIN